MPSFKLMLVQKALLLLTFWATLFSSLSLPCSRNLHPSQKTARHRSPLFWSFPMSIPLPLALEVALEPGPPPPSSGSRERCPPMRPSFPFSNPKGKKRNLPTCYGFSVTAPPALLFVFKPTRTEFLNPPNSSGHLVF